MRHQSGSPFGKGDTGGFGVEATLEIPLPYAKKGEMLIVDSPPRIGLSLPAQQAQSTAGITSWFRAPRTKAEYPPALPPVPV